jgi:hypothetical protein
MSCNAVWGRRFIAANFSSTWVAKTLKNHLEDVYYERELALVQGTQDRVNEYLENKRIKDEIKRIDDEIYELKKKKDRLMNPWRFQTGRVEAPPKPKLMMRCPVTDCLGFVDEEYHCNVCQTDACKKCREIKTQTHECDPGILENVEAMKKDTKPCPNCASMIFKIIGCDQMYCVECKTFFSWKTLKIQTTGPRHNPHYFEYQATLGTVPRNPNDVLCGRTLDGHLSRKLKQFNLQHLVQPLSHLQNVTLLQLNTEGIEDRNTTERILYITKERTKEQFKRSIQQREKANKKKQELRDILQLFIQVSTDNLYKLVQDKSPIDFEKSTKAILEYCNSEFIKINKAYKCKTYRLTTKFTLE